MCAALTRLRGWSTYYWASLPRRGKASDLASQLDRLCFGTSCIPFSGCHAEKNALKEGQGNQGVGPIVPIAVEGGYTRLTWVQFSYEKYTEIKLIKTMQLSRQS
jgi:hypothetical protein